jgi:hypothetical protein
VCRIFSKAWETDRTRSEIIASHSYFVGDERYGRPSFPRFEKYIAAEPRRHPIKSCKCGRPDRWKCWSKFYARQLLGEARAARGVRFKTDWEILDALDPMIIVNRSKLADVIDITEFSGGHSHEPTVHSVSDSPHMETTL